MRKRPWWRIALGADRRGLAYGWSNAVGIATFLASLLVGRLYPRFGVLAAFGAGAALALLAGLMMPGVGTERVWLG